MCRQFTKLREQLSNDIHVEPLSFTAITYLFSIATERSLLQSAVMVAALMPLAGHDSRRTLKTLRVILGRNVRDMYSCWRGFPVRLWDNAAILGKIDSGFAERVDYGKEAPLCPHTAYTAFA
jgi:hypothetical protein